jgi:HKD family nuclease
VGLMEVEVKSRLELASGSQACSAFTILVQFSQESGVSSVLEVIISKLIEATPG